DRSDRSDCSLAAHSRASGNPGLLTKIHCSASGSPLSRGRADGGRPYECLVMGVGSWTIVGILLALLAGAVAFAYFGWTLEPGAMPLSLVLPMILGIVFS